MPESALDVAKVQSPFSVHHESITLQAERRTEFIDITDRVIGAVVDSGIQFGWVNIQTRHTTTAIVVNESEPLLLDDAEALLERLAAANADYRHNDMSIRTVNLVPDESPNGHSHCRAMLLGASETVNVVGGTLNLGKWQRIFLVELDGVRRREISLMIMGSSMEGCV
jgi:secondary thiamine-phosphate synthase enzyme